MGATVPSLPRYSSESGSFSESDGWLTGRVEVVKSSSKDFGELSLLVRSAVALSLHGLFIIWAYALTVGYVLGTEGV